MASVDRKERNGAESEEDQKGLLEQPLVVRGKRQRKTIEQFSVEHVPKKAKVKYEGGTGVKLGDIARVEFFISKHNSDDLKPLHRLCFDRPGTKTEIKKNLRGFSGFSFPKDSDSYSRKKNNLEKLTKSGLKVFLAVLDLPRSGSKEEQVEKIMEFLLTPQDSGKAAPKTTKRRRRSSSGKKGKTSRKKRKAATTSTSEEEEEELELPSEESEDEEEDEEEEVESEKETAPSDDELYDIVKELLKDADLDTVTTNSVCKQVFVKFPDIDLTGKRDFIKTCIEKVLVAT